MRFRVRALASNAAIVETELEAVSEGEARALLEARGLVPLSLHEGSGGRWGHRFPLLLFNQELLSLLRAGITLAEGVAALAEKEQRPGVRATLLTVLAALREGRSFSSALESESRAFPGLYVAMMRAAERTSDLDRALARFIEYQQEGARLRDKLIGAAIYPALLLVVGGAVVLFLLGYVVPRFSGIYQDLGNDQPWMSQMLLEWGRLVETHGAAVGSGVLVATALAVAVLRSMPVRAALMRQLWRLPYVGEQMRVYELARFYRALGMLLGGGIAAVPALGMVAGLLAPPMRVRLDSAAERIRRGERFSTAMSACGMTTPVALRMFEVGERAGNLGEMLDRAAAFHEEDTARSVEWLTRLFGPLLMLIMGCAIGLIVVLMYLPIFQLAESIG